jgi:hypothetical protein
VLHLLLTITLNLIWVTTVLGLQYPMSDFGSTGHILVILELTSALLTGDSRCNCFHILNVAGLYFVTEF